MDSPRNIQGSVRENVPTSRINQPVKSQAERDFETFEKAVRRTSAERISRLPQAERAEATANFNQRLSMYDRNKELRGIRKEGRILKAQKAQEERELAAKEAQEAAEKAFVRNMQAKFRKEEMERISKEAEQREKYLEPSRRLGRLNKEQGS